MAVSAFGKKRVLDVMPKMDDWKREISRLSTEIHAAAISKYLEDTGNWLFN
jgi:hypothetical protein